MKLQLIILATLTSLLATTPTLAVAPLDPQFEGVDVENKLGLTVDKDIPLIGPDGRQTSLAEFLDGDKSDTNPEPRVVLLTMNYFRCESICSVQLNELLTTLVGLGWQPGDVTSNGRFRIVTVSFDPSDTVEIAAGKQEAYRVELMRKLAEKVGDTNVPEQELHRRAQSVDWTFLVAREKAIQALTANLGYWVKYDEPTKQYAHSPVIYVLSPAGVITRYLWGITIEVNDLKFGLMEASNGVLGSFGDKVLASCFVFENGKYAFAWSIMRIGGSIIALGIVTWLVFWWRRERKRPASPGLAGLKTMENGR